MTGVPASSHSSSSGSSLLAAVQYAPASLATYNITAAALAALDTTNLTVSFTVPASGIVVVRVTICANLAAATDALAFGLLNHSGGAQVGVTYNATHANVTGTQVLSPAWRLASLSAGTLALDVAAGAVTTGTCHAFAQGATGAASGSNAGPALIEVLSV